MSETRVAAIRRFNRFYTKQIGVLDEGLLKSPFTLAEVRVLYEIANGKDVSAGELAESLGLDPGYLSRILHRFENSGLVRRTISREDARRSLLTLTTRGARTFATLNRRQIKDVEAMLSRVPPSGRKRLIDAMRTIEALLEPKAGAREPVVIRNHRPGDIGWVTHRHGVLYSQEYGYDERFEALVAKIAAAFIENFDPARERCWIAERNGAIAGSVFLVKKSATVSQLRMLYVEPSARGSGIGARLIDECIRFARQAGYRKITLWTQRELTAARHLYEKAGFELVGEEAHESFSRNDLFAETWELKL